MPDGLLRRVGSRFGLDGFRSAKGAWTLVRCTLLVVSIVLTLTMFGCDYVGVGPKKVSTPATTSETGTEAVGTPGGSLGANAAALASQTPALAEKTASTPRPSASSIDYAKSLGGASQVGDALYFVIGDSVQTEREAQSLLDKATPKFGDMQSYFIVQRSDSFEGLRPGWWVVLEAYRKPPSEENLQFGKRGFPGAYVKRATVRTTDPIPVYDDLTGQ
jgi:hypothetical protein